MITISQRAKEQLQRLWQRQKEAQTQTPPKKLRLFIRGGGCSGLKYGFMLDQSVPCESDTLLTLGSESLAILIDAVSLYYLHNASLDFEESLQSSAFVIQNPNVRTSCACGSSFEL